MEKGFCFFFLVIIFAVWQGPFQRKHNHSLKARFYTSFVSISFWYQGTSFNKKIGYLKKVISGPLCLRFKKKKMLWPEMV